MCRERAMLKVCSTAMPTAFIQMEVVMVFCLFFTKFIKYKFRFLLSTKLSYTVSSKEAG